MASASICRSCLRSLQQRSSAVRRETRQISQFRPFTTSRKHPTVISNNQQALYFPIHKRAYATSGTESPIDATGDAHAKSAPSYTDTYLAQNATEILFKECASQADYTVPERFESGKEVPKSEAGEEIGQGSGWWYEDVGLTPTFNTWAQITYLHLYLLIVRLRYFPAEHSATWQQHLSDHFFYECEHRMSIFHGITSRALRNRYLKDINNFCRGAMVAYDEGLMKGDAVLAAALWRNIWAGKDDVDWKMVAAVVAYMRRCLKALDGASDAAVVQARLKFGNPATEYPLIEEEAPGMEMPFGAEDEEALQQFIAEAKAAPAKK